MSEPPTQPKPSLTQRIRQRLTQLRGGDVIVANVASGASDVVVGKNILKIGTLVVPALPAVIALIAVLFGGTGGLWLYLVPDTMPTGYFNVAVAEFNIRDAQGRENATNDSALIGKTLYTTIQGELAHLPSDYPAVVWQDSMSLLQKRTTIGAIAGASADTACQRAVDLNADILVYGFVDESAAEPLLRLRFCARNTTRDRDMGNLQELQKVDRLGGPLPVELPLSDIQSSINPTLRIRTTLLAKLIVGLRYELASNPNFQASIRRALATFTDARVYLEQQDGAATGDNGGDLVYYFIGRENILLFQDAGTPDTDKPALLEAARAAFQRTADLNPQYGRAWSSLGGTYYQQSRRIEGQTAANNILANAVAAYQKAIATAQASQDQPAETEARLALALTYWRIGYNAAALSNPDNTAAEEAFQGADAQLKAGDALIEPEQNRMRGFGAQVRALVLFARGQIANRTGDVTAARQFFEQTRDAFNECIAAGAADPGDQFLKRQIIEKTCAPGEQTVTQALQSLDAKTP